MRLEDMEIVPINRTGNHDILFNLFLQYCNLYDREITVVDKMVINDTISLIHRLDLPTCKKLLGRIGLKGYTNLNYSEVQKLLKENLPKQNDRLILKFYEENRVKLGCFKYEVINILNISDYKFYKIKNSLKVVGTQIVTNKDYSKKVNKYDRKYIYEIKLKNEY
ncbi:MAG: hypothetical protein SPD90_09390 [Intestinibacter sp.]|uniref:hypothetical protein n=1 Tax=Intestinibacter sp. TaxID=1965304 RepID=UPI002A820216|nr:hypothetical protein [Intestinibacter sp.]MDY4575258.1 hypothetical protein [Intestinibacter sp.]